MRRTLLLSLLLTSCGGQSVATSSFDGPAEPSAPNSIAPAAKAPEPPAKPFSVEEENELYDFSYSWPGSLPRKLVERFEADMKKMKAELVAGAEADKAERARNGFDYHTHSANRSYELAGASDRLLSLASTTYGFTGGAHGSTGSGAILWDKALDREIAVAGLLQPGTSWTGAIRQPFCVLLDREREKRRQEPVRKDDLFGNCPAFNELTVYLQDSDGNRRFDHVMVVADQYVAGPYAEGAYEIPLPITAGMIERLRPEYRSSFEPRPPVK